ncbi:hypothetical protein HZS_119 [Henneguya salminicola]|nr:hypothetical protein HZS_119 [Henneguya salminicola]
MNIGSQSQHPYYNILSLTSPFSALFHFLFRSIAFIIYMVGSIPSASFVTVFIIVLIVSSIDFWVVKNITGRFLVGMRWWNLIDDSGNSKWIFENRRHQMSFSEPPTASARIIFWLGIWLFTGIWTFMCLVNVFSLKWGWLTLTALLAAMCWANAVGYFYCSRDAGVKDTVTDAILGNVVFNSVRNK